MKEERERLIEELGEEHVRHTEWWGGEMDFCRDKLHPLLDLVRDDPDMELKQHGTSVNSDGEHEVRMKFTVVGEPWEDSE